MVRTSGRTKQKIADDFGVGMSTLTRWLAHSRNRQMEAPERSPPREDVAGELKRLRRENGLYYSGGCPHLKLGWLAPRATPMLLGTPPTALLYVRAPRPRLSPPITKKDQNNAGPSLRLDEKRVSRHRT